MSITAGGVFGRAVSIYNSLVAMIRTAFAIAVLSVARLSSVSPVAAQEMPTSLGVFEGQSDIGTVLTPGSATYDTSTKAYRLTGSGQNMWATSDEFHYVWKKVTSDNVTLTASLAISDGGENHRKGALMIRQSLDPDSAYVDAAQHGDGLTSLQFRAAKGDATHEIESSVSAPATLRLEKQGDVFYLWVTGANGAGSANNELQFAGGAAKVKLKTPFYVGIAACAHNKDATVKIDFRNVDVKLSVTHPKADYSTIETVMTSGDARVAYVSREHLTLPGWSADGHDISYQVKGEKQQMPFVPYYSATPIGPAAKAPENATSTDVGPDNFPSPDGKYLLSLSHPQGTVTTIADNSDLSLQLRAVSEGQLIKLVDFVGGKQSLGPQPWSPDARRVVFISYQNMQ